MVSFGVVDVGGVGCIGCDWVQHSVLDGHRGGKDHLHTTWKVIKLFRTFTSLAHDLFHLRDSLVLIFSNTSVQLQYYSSCLIHEQWSYEGVVFVL